MPNQKLLLLVIFGFVLCCPEVMWADTIRSSASATEISISDFYAYQRATDNLSATLWASRSFAQCGFQNRYGMKELMLATIGSALIYRQNLFSVHFSHFGFSSFGEMCFSTGYARSFGRRVAAALQIHYIYQHAADCEGIHSLTFDISLYAKISSKLGIGFSMYNPAILKYGIVGTVPLPVRFEGTINYEVGRNIWLLGYVAKELKSVWRAQIGALLKVKCIFVQTKVQFPEVACDVSVYIQWRRFLAGIAAQYQHPLGFVPEINFNVVF